MLLVGTKTTATIAESFSTSTSTTAAKALWKHFPLRRRSQRPRHFSSALRTTAFWKRGSFCWVAASCLAISSPFSSSIINSSSTRSNTTPPQFTTTTVAAAMTTTSSSSSSNTCDALLRELHPVGLGTLGIPPADAPQVIRTAVELGYRRIDCAPVYFNEHAVGDGLQAVLEEKLVERSDLFIVSKLASPFHRREHVKLALQKTLNDLRLDYLDLYLIHWLVAFQYVDISESLLSQRGYPDEEIDESGDGKRIDTTVSIHETWAAMEELVDQGLVKYIGVSNFPVSLLHELMTKCRIPPAVNQCEGHPYLPQTKLLAYCQARGVHYQAYSPLGTPGYKEKQEPTVLEDPVLVEIAESKRHRSTTSSNESSSTTTATVAQVALAWAIQRGTSVVAKASSKEHLQTNLQAAAAASTTQQSQLKLTASEMDRIATLGSRNFRYFRPEDWWGEMAMAVFD